MPNCDEYELLLSARLDGALSPQEADRLEAHLAVCPRCRALGAELTALEGLWRRLPQVPPPADLSERIRRAVEADNVTPAVPAERRERPLSWKRWVVSAAVLAVILVGAGGLGLFHPGAAPRSADQDRAAAPAASNSEGSMASFGAAIPKVQGAGPEENAAKMADQPSAALTLSLPPQAQALALCADQLFSDGETDEAAPSDTGEEVLSLHLPDGSRVVLTCGEADGAGRYPVTCQSGDSTTFYWVDLADGSVTPQSP